MKFFALIILLCIACSPETETRAALIWKTPTESGWVTLEPGDTLIMGKDTFLVRMTEQQAVIRRAPSKTIKFNNN